jgi:PAS domain S-box-containing protein
MTPDRSDPLSFSPATPSSDGEAVIRAAPFGIFVCDVNGRYRSVNPKACAMTGHSATELLAMAITDLLPPDGVEAGLDHFRHLLDHGHAHSEMRYRTKKGEVRWWSVNAVRLSPDRYLGFCEDITVRRVAEAEVEHLADMLQQTNSLARVGGWWIDFADQTLHWSEVTRAIHEVGADYQPAIATGISFYKEGDSRTRIAAAVAAGLRDGTPFDLEAQIITARGREVWVRVIGRFRGPPGHPTMMYGAFQDIDAAKRVQLELERAHAEAEAANAAKSLFLAKASHELRTPINSMLGLADLLEIGESDPDRRAMLERLGRAGRILRDLVNDALDHERLGLGRVVMERIPVDLRDLLRQCEEQFAAQFHSRQVGFSCVAAESVPSWILGDPTRLRQILTNLIANALRFTPAGGTVTVGVATCSGGGRLRCAVADTGLGIAHDRQVAIFQPFIQADVSVARTHGGTGLGLSICRQLVECMDGMIGVDSALGEGSCFWFEIPLETASGPLVVAPGSESVARPDPLGLRVLVAEDDEISRFTIARMLESLGCRHQVVGDGQAAVTAAAEAPYDVVLMDLQMPILDGCEATQAIRASGSRVPILLLSASTAAEDLGRARAAGVDANLVKPMTLSGLRRALRGMTPTPAP